MPFCYFQVGKTPDQAILPLFEALGQNDQLKSLILPGNHAFYLKELLERMQQLLENNYSLTSIMFTNKVSPPALGAIAYRNKCLEKQKRFTKTKVAAATIMARTN